MRPNLPHSGEDVNRESSPEWDATDSSLVGIVPVMGNGLKSLRERAGMTHLQAGEAMGISRGAFIKLERGERKLSADYIGRAVKVFGASEREVLGSGINLAEVVGTVGAGSVAHFYADAHSPNEWVEAPSGASEKTVAVQIRGDSLGPMFDGWYAFYDDVRHPPGDDLVGRMCIVGLDDDRVLIKALKRGRDGAWTLLSNTEPPIYDVAVRWAAEVIDMQPASRLVAISPTMRRQ